MQLTGIILTKLDGTARGGAVVSSNETGSLHNQPRPCAQPWLAAAIAYPPAAAGTMPAAAACVFLRPCCCPAAAATCCGYSPLAAGLHLNPLALCLLQVSVVDELGVPVKFVGVGEGVQDLQPFQPATFVDALFPEDGGKAAEEADVPTQ